MGLEPRTNVAVSLVICFLESELGAGDRGPQGSPRGQIQPSLLLTLALSKFIIKTQTSGSLRSLVTSGLMVLRIQMNARGEEAGTKKG